MAVAVKSTEPLLSALGLAVTLRFEGGIFVAGPVPEAPFLQAARTRNSPNRVDNLAVICFVL